MSQRDELEGMLARSVMELIDTGHRGISTTVDLTRVRIVGLIAGRGPVRPGTIATELALTKSAVSRHLTALEHAGHIIVEDDPHDARTFHARITDAGQADIDATIAAGAHRFSQVVADWADEDIATARTVVERLVRAWAAPLAVDPPAEPTPRPRWKRRRQTTDSKEKIP